MKEKKIYSPTLEELETELLRSRYDFKYKHAVRNAIHTLLVVGAVTILVATLLIPMLRIYGESMTPTLYNGNIVAALKPSDFKRGDIIAFYYNNNILVKRVIALPGEWVNIDENGDLYINDVYQEEAYLEEGAKDFGTSDLEYPFQVPEGRYFVMGDHRKVSADSRISTIGCVSKEQIVGKLFFRIWPLKNIGKI